MTTEYEGCKGHERFKELAALAVCGVLTHFELSELKAHLRNCRECREACQQYLILTTEGMPALSAVYAHPQGQEAWDDTATRKKLLARVRASLQSNPPTPRAFVFLQAFSIRDRLKIGDGVRH